MKDIENYEGLYAVDENGNVWSYKSKKFLKPLLTRNGYCQVNLCKNNKCKKFLIHRLVAEAFIPNLENKPQVNHKDEDKSNNCVENLEWATAKENSNYGTRNKRVSKANSTPVYCIELDKTFYGAREAARELELDNSHIIKCCKGKLKTTGGFHFRYAEVAFEEI